ncbi:MAG TPA: DinB family protein [Anaerolineales bacterium]|nr:DinB family protein [Anaerolineales bacterium]
MNRDFQIANKASREKMRVLVESMSDEQLALPTVAGWTIASTLAHIAFWDFRILYLLNHWKENEIAPSPYDVDAINEAHKPLCLALSPRIAARLALQASEAIGSEIEKTPDELVEKILAAKVQFKFERNEHREYHIKEITEALNNL